MMRRKNLVIIMMLLITMLTTVVYATEVTPRTGGGTFQFNAVSETDNTSFESLPVTRNNLFGNSAIITPTVATGEYNRLNLHVKYKSLNGTTYSRCTGYKTFSKYQFTIPYTSHAGDTGVFKLCGTSGYGLFTAGGGWSTN